MRSFNELGALAGREGWSNVCSPDELPAAPDAKWACARRNSEPGSSPSDKQKVILGDRFHRHPPLPYGHS